MVVIARDAPEAPVNPLYKERVHVAFLGWEIERIVKPILEMRGNRLIIICFPKDQEGAWAYYEEIKRQLEAKNIKVEVIEESLYAMVDLLAILNKVFQVETRKGNDVYINVSAGTKISACASTIAAMTMPGITAYYVNMKTYYPRDDPNFKKDDALQTLTTGFIKSETLPECQISVPDQKYIRTLHAMTKMKHEGHDKIYIKDLIEFLKKNSILAVKENVVRRKEKSSEYMAIKKIADKLVEWKYVMMSPKKRNKFLELTEKGMNAVRMYLDFDLGDEDLKENKDKSIVEWITYLGSRV
jgi:hypothetical protein